MGLLFEFSKPNDRTYPMDEYPAKKKQGVIGEQIEDVTWEEVIEAVNTIGDKQRIKGRDIALMSVLVVLAFFGMLFIVSVFFSFSFLMSNPEILDAADPFVAAQTMLEDQQNEIFGDLTLYTYIIYTIALFAGVGFIGRRISQQWEIIGMRQLDSKKVQYALLIGLTAGLSLTGGTLFAASMVNELDPLLDMLDAFIMDMPLLLSGVLLVTAIFALPMAEELFFRGVIHTWIRWNRRAISAIFISGAIYAFLNINPIAIAPSLLVGMGLALVYERTQSVWAAFLAHSTFNFVSLMLYLILIITR